MSPLDHPVAYALLGISFLACCVLLAGLCRAAARPTNAAPAPEVQPVQGRAAKCSVQWCPTANATKAYRGWDFCDVHYADLVNVGALPIIADADSVLAEEATAYLRKEGGAA